MSGSGASLEQRSRDRIGAVIRGKYRLDRLLGVGGMGAVFAATHVNNAHRVAVKLLHAEVSVVAEVRARFLREGYVANSVEHPGIVKVLDDDVAEDGSVFLVLELLEGETLGEVRARGPVEPQFVITASRDLLDVLAAAHEKGVVHRDIKPDNVFLTKRGEIKILDFGIARMRDAAGATATATGQMLGSPAFMSPEQARGQMKSVGPQSDLWSVGAMMFTLLTGKYVHEEETLNLMLIATATRQAPSLASIAPGLPAPLVAIVDRALALDPERRWSSAAEMRDALAALAIEPSVTRRLIPSDPQLRVEGPGELDTTSISTTDAAPSRTTAGVTSPVMEGPARSRGRFFAVVGAAAALAVAAIASAIGASAMRSSPAPLRAEPASAAKAPASASPPAPPAPPEAPEPTSRPPASTASPVALASAVLVRAPLAASSPARPAKPAGTASAPAPRPSTKADPLDRQ